MDEEKEIPKYRKDNEMTDLLDEMKRIGIRRFREMWGQETLDSIKEIVKEEERIAPIRQKIRLQGILKHDWPICEKCVNWIDPAAEDWKPCPYENLEKGISFEKGELAQNPMAVEVCEMFIWVKET